MSLETQTRTNEETITVLSNGLQHTLINVRYHLHKKRKTRGVAIGGNCPKCKPNDVTYSIVQVYYDFNLINIQFFYFDLIFNYLIYLII